MNNKRLREMNNRIMSDFRINGIPGLPAFIAEYGNYYNSASVEELRSAYRRAERQLKKEYIESAKYS